MRLLSKRHDAYPLTFFFFLSSCATLTNTPVQKLFIATDTKIKVLSVDKALVIDSSGTRGTKVYFVPRSNSPLLVKIKVDSSIKEWYLEPKKSFEYWMNIPTTYGIGMLVDKNNVKRYSYPANNYFSATGSGIRRSKFAPVEKGAINFSFSLPFMMNQFVIKTPDGQYNSAGVFGVKAGLEYFYKRNNYLSLNAGAATDVFGEYFPYDSGYTQHGYAFFASLKDNKVIGSFDLGYGVQFSQLKWRKNFGDTTRKDLVIKNRGIGPALSLQFRIGQYFRTGIFYQPLVYDTKTMSFTNYQHYLSMDFFWKLPLRASRR